MKNYSMSNLELAHPGSPNDVKKSIGEAPLGAEGDFLNMNKEKKEELFSNLKKLADLETVDHPAHYNREDALECIDEMVLLFGKAETMTFCKLNAWKYRYRAADKNGEEDLRKSDWYIAKYKELKGSYDDDRVICRHPYMD